MASNNLGSSHVHLFVQGSGVDFLLAKINNCEMSRSDVTAFTRFQLMEPGKQAPAETKNFVYNKFICLAVSVSSPRKSG